MRFGISGRRFGTLRAGRRTSLLVTALAAASLAAGLAGCKSNVIGGINETYHAGFIPPENGLDQIPIGASQDQVRIVLGSPSTTADFGGEVWYYISQTRVRPALFQRQRVVDQRVIAIYFDKDRKITRVADYGLKDGHVFDFITQTTPTGGKDQAFLEQVLTGALGVGANNPFGG